jgi:hypothetical protein
MDINNKKIKKRDFRKPLSQLSQREIITRINKNTRKSYRLFELLYPR